MRILMVTELVPESDVTGITGGVEARTFYLQRRLAEDHSVVVIADRTDGTRWDAASVASMFRRLTFVVRAFTRGIRTSFDVVEGSNFVVYPIAWLLARLKRRPLVLCYHDVLIGRWREDFGRAGWVGELVERLILRIRVHAYIANSQTTARKLLDHGVKPDLVHVIPCGFEPRVIAEATAAPRDVTCRTIAAVGRLVSYKRVDVIIRALAQLPDEHSDVQLRIIGQGPEREALGALAHSLGVADRVQFLGYVPSHVDVLREMSAARLFVSASEIEGFGIVVVESMALGVPYVVADNEAFTEVTSGGVGGALFRQGDPADLAGKIALFLERPDFYERARREGPERAERFRWADIAATTAHVYAEAIRRYAA